MNSRARLLATVAIAVAILGAGVFAAWLLDRGEPVASGSSESGLPDADRPDRAAARVDPAGLAEAGESRSAPVVDRAIEAEPAPAPPLPTDVEIEPWPERGIPVVVVDRDTREPEPFALVTWCDDVSQAVRPDYYAPHDTDDVDWLLDHCKRNLRADERGALIVPTSIGVVELCARSGSNLGWTGLRRAEAARPRDASPQVIEVSPRLALRLQVVDPTGRPVAGVGIWCENAESVLASWFDYQETAAPDGIAEFPCAELLLDPAADEVAEFAVDLPLRSPVRALLTRENLGGPPVRMALPATGSVELRLVDDAGALLPIETTEFVTLLRGPRRADFTGEQSSLAIGDVEACFENGRAELPLVEIGDWVEIALDLDGWGPASATARGPTSPGERVRIDVPVPGRPRWLTARAIDESGRPIADQLLRVVLERAGDSGDRRRFPWLWTSADGSFRLSADRLDPADEVREWLDVRLEAPERIELRCRIEIPKEAVREGGFLGDLVLRPEKTLASGVVVDDRGAPVASARLILERLKDYPDAESVWDLEAGFEATSCEDGSFEILGDPGPGEYQLVARAKGTLDSEPAIFDPGQVDLRLVVRRSSSAIVHVLLDPEVVPRRNESVPGVHVRMVQESGDHFGGERQSWMGPDANGDVLFEGFSAGRAFVAVGINGFGANEMLDVVALDDVELVAGELTRDPRLQAVDLRGLFRTTALEVVDPEGAPVAGGRVIGVDAFREEQRRHEAVETLDGGSATIVTVGAPPEVEIEAEGFRPQRVVLAPPRMRVVLQPGIEVAFSLDPAFPPIPEAMELQISTARGGPADLEQERIGGYEDPWQLRRVEPGAPAVVRFERPGEHLLQVWLVKYGDDWIQVEEIEGARSFFEVSEAGPRGTVVVRASADAVETALREFADDY